MVSWFLRVEHVLTRLALAIAILMLIVSVSLGFYQVLTRFLFNAPSTWSGDAVTVDDDLVCVYGLCRHVPRRLYDGRRGYLQARNRSPPCWRLEWFIGLCCLLVLSVLVFYATSK